VKPKLKWRWDHYNEWWISRVSDRCHYVARRLFGANWTAIMFDPHSATYWQHPDVVKYSHNAMKLCERHWESQQ
jgi:hypothetical protein